VFREKVAVFLNIVRKR